MIAMLLALLVSQDGTGATTLRGQCQYSEAVARFRDETSLVLCDSLAIDRGGDAATFGFSRGSWGSMLSFSGEMSGQRMTVSSVRLRSGRAVSATGTCEIFHIDGRPSMVACLARAGSRRYAANFRPSRR